MIDELLGEMHDEAPVRIELAGGVQALHELAVARDALERGAAHAGHELHVEHHVRAVRDLDAAARERRVDRVPCSRAPRTSCVPSCSRRTARPSWRAPRRAPSSGCWGPRRRGLRVQTKVRCSTRATSEGCERCRWQPGKLAGLSGSKSLLATSSRSMRLILRVAAVAPMDAIRLRELRDLIDPGRDVAVQRVE